MVWHAQPESDGHSFGDLMVWSWFRRRRAEDHLKQSATVVGLARDGSFRDAGTVSLIERQAALADMAVSLDAKSTFTVGHSKRVQEHARDIADELELSVEDTDALAIAALLHNVGNLAIPEEVLRKTDELTDAERTLIEQHVELGASLAMTAGLERPVVDAIQHHHERWDGAGYPDRLSGEDIPLLARVLAVAESYDAMTSTRPYRHGLSRAEAIAELRSGAGSQFDPAVVEALVATLPSERGILAAAALPAIAQRRIQQTGVAFRRVGRVALSATASTIAIALVLGATVLDSGVPRPADDVRPDRDRITDQVLGTRITEGGSVEAAAGHEALETDTDVDGVVADDEADEDEATVLAGGVESDPILVGSIDSTDGSGTTGPYPGAPGGGGGTTGPGTDPGTDPGTEPEPEPEPQPTTEPEPQPEPSPDDDGKPGNGKGRDKDKPKDEPTPDDGGDSSSPPGHSGTLPQQSNGNGTPGGGKDEPEPSSL
jgi:putative nucleotidyltransferase with HDIG domain